MTRLWKHFSIFIYLSFVAHLYLLYFLSLGLEGTFRKWMQSSQKPHYQTVVENIIVNTPTESQKPKRGILSDKANRRSGKKSKRLRYNYLNPNPTPLRSVVQPQIKDLPGNLTVKKQDQENNGNPAPTMFDLKKSPVIEMDNSGVGSLDTLPSDIADYLLKVNHRISEKWHGFFPVFQYYQGIMKDGEVIVYFEIAPDGKLANSKVVQSYGYRMMDDSCLNAVRYAAPFDAFPKNFPIKDVLQIRFKFIYLSR